MPSYTDTTAEHLTVDAQVLTRPVRLSYPCQVRVSVTNRAGRAVLVNGRLAIGYRGGDHREVFADVFLPGEDTVVGVEALRYARDPATPHDFVWLPSEDSASTTFDLLEWYDLPGPGDYELVVNYQADGPLAVVPDDLLRGTYASERVPFTVSP